MKYYISKPNAHKLDEDILNGIKRTDGEVIIVDSLEKADVCVFQNGWTKSRICVSEYHMARDRKIKRVEGYLYKDKYNVKLN